jgi:hypothetical protein
VAGTQYPTAVVIILLLISRLARQNTHGWLSVIRCNVCTSYAYIASKQRRTLTKWHVLLISSVLTAGCTIWEILWHVDPLLGNELTDTFPLRLILRKWLITGHISMDTSDQQTFPWILICYIRGRSDQNEVGHKSEGNRSSAQNR